LIENVIEGNLGAIRIAVFAGFNRLLGFVQGGGIDQDDAWLFWRGVEGNRVAS
jgi:hypothetical protein